MHKYIRASIGATRQSRGRGGDTGTGETGRRVAGVCVAARQETKDHPYNSPAAGKKPENNICLHEDESRHDDYLAPLAAQQLWVVVGPVGPLQVAL
jgi:hypothetical protein